MFDDIEIGMEDRTTMQQQPPQHPTIDDVHLGLPERAGGVEDFEVGFGGGTEDSEGYEQEDQTEPVTGPVETPCSFLTGVSGSGKSYTIRERLREDPSYAVLAATTGIAAVNLNATTIHSLLGFFDTDSLRDAYLSRAAQRKLKQIIGDGYKNVVLDEISMCSHDTLDLLVRVFDDTNQNLAHGERPIGLVATGDFMQLPAIPDKKASSNHGGGGRQPKIPTPWAFDAISWPRFERNMTRLTKVWRQADARFIAALNYARAGQGAMAADALYSAGVKFETVVNMEFDGTTLVGKNEEVDRFNQMALDRVTGRLIGLPARRWGKVRSEWKNIPDRTVLREGAYVMLLANKYEAGELVYANGDCGHVRGIEPSTSPLTPPALVVELVRNGLEVRVEPIVRGVESRDKLEGTGEYEVVDKKSDVGGYIPRPHFRGAAKRYVSGQINYYPIRLAYATTVHKAQGLSLDRVQIDFRSWMMKGPAMAYVSMSRGRTIEGLRIVGMKERVAEYCTVDKRALRWL